MRKKQISLIGINARYTHSCLALFYVRNELVKNCSAEVSLHQYTINDPYYQLLLRVCDSASDYYFLSSAIWNSDLMVKLIEDLLKIDSQAVCIVGGPQAEVVTGSIADVRCICVTGEIERVSREFYRDIERGTLQQHYVCNERKSGFSSPYEVSDLQDHLLNRHVYYETSRGCPFSCSYCLSAANKGVYHKDIRQVKSELAVILAENPREIRFVDRTFNDNLARALTIWEYLVTQNCDTSFHFEINPDRFSEDMFSFLKKLPPGKFEFEIGIQSTNQMTLDAIGRPVDTTLAHQTIERLAEFANIHLHVDLILGLPHDTEDSFLTSFRDVFAMKPHYIQMGLLKILPNTPICSSAADFGYTYSSSPPYPVLSNNWLDHERMQKLYWFSECVERFINNRYFVSLWGYLRRKSVDIVDFFAVLADECRKENFFQRAPTQELLARFLADVVSGDKDEEYVLQLLRYDWLRCGHKYLPEKLGVPEEASSRMVKRRLFDRLPAGEPSSLSAAEKAYCFKKGFFLEFSAEVLKDLGYSLAEGHHVLCFLPERERSLYRYCRTILFTLHHKKINQ